MRPATQKMTKCRLLCLFFSLLFVSLVKGSSLSLSVCSETDCPQGGCTFEKCENSVTCSGGNCHFTDCNRPSCAGGLCTFINCAFPTCGGGSCDFTEISVPLREGFCKGGACTVDGEPVFSSFTGRLAYWALSQIWIYCIRQQIISIDNRSRQKKLKAALHFNYLKTILEQVLPSPFYTENFQYLWKTFLLE